MANHNGSASIADAPPQDPYSMPMSINVADIVEEDEDEYEYEYSSTEKEIFYVTLDLTTPNVPVKRKLAQTHPRRNAKKWLNPGLGKHRRHLGDSTTIVIDKEKPAKAKGKAKGKSAKKPLNVEDDDEPVEGEEVEEPLEDEMAQPVSISKPVEAGKSSTGEQYSNFIADTKRGGEAPATFKPEVQILGLHEDNPVVSYEGNIYQCRWEENMGTELLFTAHDPHSKLPILQSVSNEVDLLAASSARITSVNTKVEDKDPMGGSGGKRRNYFWRSGNIRELKIPVGVAASEQRKNQAFFLQSLIQVKESKRERDHVTVMARRRNTNRQWRAIMKQKQAAEVAQIRKAMATGKMNRADGQQRLDQMTKDNEILAAEDKLRGIGTDGRKIRHGGRKKTVNADQQIVRRPPGGLTNYLMNNAAPEDEDGMDTGLDGVADMTPLSYSIGEDEDMEAGDYVDGVEMNGGVEYEYGEDGEMNYEDDGGFEEDYEIE
ncbi:89136ccf-021b-4ce7-98dd-b6d781657a51 [Sclerotinia trifoliorum]|uniref:89136ccf-021b-4ce7-98dd-b6d781657a51 n=1 Tax=Sclerotinia trifoliorum TaxID=28548 RepID=A0A8H2VUG0_9HELO|nr:89136ccf-021b-4ce7-98dd-b6d781657a51 [Sclerotinia trifoliorum]